MNVLMIQHDAADPPSAAADVVTELGHTITLVRLDRGDSIPRHSDADVMMSFGGNACLSDPKLQLPDWVAAEIALMQSFEESGRKVLGICLGAQLLTLALGAKVTRNPHPEVGWHQVRRTGDSAPHAHSALTFPERFVAFHWHRDTFEIPNGAVHLFASDACNHQGFTVDDRLYGLQFHLEAVARTVEIFLAVSPLWRQPSRFVQSETQIMRGVSEYLENQQRILHQFLSRFLACGESTKAAAAGGFDD